jgi:hypothetical protein
MQIKCKLEFGKSGAEVGMVAKQGRSPCSKRGVKEAEMES